jgi:putative colanic acid biosynthesis acetyltransferase WcaF
MIRSTAKETLFQRVLWNIVWTIFVRPFPRCLASNWEIFLLKLFGAHIEKGCVIYSSAKIMLPKNLNMEENAHIADHVYIQNSAPFYMKKNSEISQYCYICDGSHELDNPDEGFDKSIVIGERSWIGADCFVALGVKIGRGCIVGARSVVRLSTPPYSLIMGNPAKVVGFVRDVDDIIKYEVETYPESERIKREILDKNYKKYFFNKISDIKKFVSL